MKNLILASSAILLAACANDASAPPANAAEMDDEADVEADFDVADCPVFDSRDWSAWIDAQPPGPPRLHIRGEVDLPTPGYKALWRIGAADRMMPPGVRFHLSFEKPDGIVSQVISTESIAYKGEASYPDYRVIYVMCGERTLAEINEIPTAQ